ncbi:MAG: coenzyme F420-0:L-glutamate ligase, partial [Candidatus Bathyarchaeia archaeon]
GRLLAYVCHMMPATRMRLRGYPQPAGSQHKEFVLRTAGLLHALKHASEGGIDVNNLPGTLAALPLRNAGKVAENIRRAIFQRTGRAPAVLISDSDRTFSFGSLHFTPRIIAVQGIHGGGGALAYVVGAAFRLKARATLVAAAGTRAPIEHLLDICEFADQVRGHGAGRDVWEMAERFQTGHTGVTWEMLESIPHKPIVVVRERGTDSPRNAHAATMGSRLVLCCITSVWSKVLCRAGYVGFRLL